MIHIDLKYATLLSNQFDRWTKKADYLFNVRCPLCGDSQVKKTKMRGYIYRIKQRLAYKCHNCGASIGFGSLLKHMNPTLHKEWTLEVLKETRPGMFKLRELIKKPGFLDQDTIRFDKVDTQVYTHAERVIDLPDGHFCREYVKARRIPKEYWHKLYFTAAFKDFVDEIAPNHGKTLVNECRLVIPYYDAWNAIVAITGRDLIGKPDALRYVTIRVLDGDMKLVYGLDRVNQNELVTVVEGPLDSLFLHNAVASGDANLVQVAKRLIALNVRLVYDNEPRNKEIIEQMEKAIKQGYSVCVWPAWLKEKDINQMILAEYTPASIEKIIQEHTVQGLGALARLAFWKKV
jgi:hypothetical protein